jgi:hypothetical protein
MQELAIHLLLDQVALEMIQMELVNFLVQIRHSAIQIAQSLLLLFEVVLVDQELDQIQELIQARLPRARRIMMQRLQVALCSALVEVADWVVAQRL